PLQPRRAGQRRRRGGGDLADVQAEDGGGREEGLGLFQERRHVVHERRLDEAAREGLPGDAFQYGQRRPPFVVVLAQQVARSLQQWRAPRVAGRQVRQGVLHGDEVGAIRLALLVEPVGVDQARGDVGGVGDDVLEERFLVRGGHDGPPAARGRLSDHTRPEAIRATAQAATPCRWKAALRVPTVVL